MFTSAWNVFSFMPSFHQFDPERHDRRSLRLKGHDYLAGRYFVTFCTYDRAALLGRITDGRTILSVVGILARDHWLAIPVHYDHVRVDAFVVMPDHVHGIVELTRRSGQDHSPRAIDGRPLGPARGSLGAIVGSYRAGVTRQANIVRGTRVDPLWQRGYHDIVIRNDRIMSRVREYIGRHPPMQG